MRNYSTHKKVQVEVYKGFDLVLLALTSQKRISVTQ